jgi:hypothetical protein
MKLGERGEAFFVEEHEDPEQVRIIPEFLNFCFVCFGFKEHQ